MRSSDILDRLCEYATRVRNSGEWGGLAEVLVDAAAEIGRLRFAIRRLAEQDATLSVCDGAVTVQVDATLTDAEREAITNARNWLERWQQAGGYHSAVSGDAEALRGLLERLTHERGR